MPILGIFGAPVYFGHFPRHQDRPNQLLADGPCVAANIGSAAYLLLDAPRGRRRISRADRLCLGPEAQVRYGLLMKAMGEPQLAEEAFRDAVKAYGRRRNRLDPADREWIAQAKSNLG